MQPHVSCPVTFECIAGLGKLFKKNHCYDCTRVPSFKRAATNTSNSARNPRPFARSVMPLMAGGVLMFSRITGGKALGVLMCGLFAVSSAAPHFQEPSDFLPTGQVNFKCSDRITGPIRTPSLAGQGHVLRLASRRSAPMPLLSPCVPTKPTKWGDSGRCLLRVLVRAFCQPCRLH